MTSSINRDQHRGRLKETIAGKLREVADVLAQQEADGFRVSANRRAAGTVETLPSSIGDIAHADGLDGLMALPAIGRGIAQGARAWEDERLGGYLHPDGHRARVPGDRGDRKARSLVRTPRGAGPGS
jgi:hypothetical protein